MVTQENIQYKKYKHKPHCLLSIVIKALAIIESII